MQPDTFQILQDSFSSQGWANKSSCIFPSRICWLPVVQFILVCEFHFLFTKISSCYISRLIQTLQLFFVSVVTTNMSSDHLKLICFTFFICYVCSVSHSFWIQEVVTILFHSNSNSFLNVLEVAVLSLWINICNMFEPLLY